MCSGLDEPNKATCATPKAAATCIRPESLLTTARALAITSIAVSKSVCPARLRTCWACSALTGAAMPSHNAASLADPISTVGRPNERARALK